MVLSTAFIFVNLLSFPADLLGCSQVNYPFFSVVSSQLLQFSGIMYTASACPALYAKEVDNNEQAKSLYFYGNFRLCFEP